MSRLVPVLLLGLLSACSEGPATPGTPVSFENVCDKANEGKRVSLVGYLSFPGEFKSNEISIMMRMRPEIEKKPENVIGVSAKLGSQIDVPPQKFSDADIKLHLSGGGTAGYQDKVKVSGSMYFANAMANVDFKCGLTNTLIEKAPQ